MRTIAIVNQKGGCGKTTVAINLAATLARQGRRTLLVDMDPQGHCGLGLSVPEEQVERSISELLTAGLSGAVQLDQLIWQAARRLDLIPATMSLAGVEQRLSGASDKDRRLAQVLSPLQERYEFCIIDCPPSIGLLTFNALRAASEVIVPVETGYFALQGAKKQQQTIEMLAHRVAHRLRLHVLATMYDPAAAHERGRERALELARAAVTGDPTIGDTPIETDDATFESDCTPEAFAERVRRVKEYVRDGDTFQANVSQRLRAPAAVHPVAAFAALRRVNPAPYSALLEFPGMDLVSASPELLLDVNEDELLTEPIAGTRPRGDTPKDDAELERDLLADEKERAEHAMLVDLERNDLGKVSKYGSVGVPEYRRVDRYSEVMHLVSLVEGRLRADRDLVDAVAATFPGGTITGAPKPRTMAIIDEVEATRRGPYTGSIGVFGFDGRATLNMTIRTLVRRGEEYFLRVGAGIVHDSEPEREYAETMDKGRALIAAIDDALGDRGELAVERATAADGGASGADDEEAEER